MSLSRREFIPAAVAALTGAAGPTGESMSSEPKAESPAEAERRLLSTCKYQDEDLGCHPAQIKVIAALMLVEESMQHAFDGYKPDSPGEKHDGQLLASLNCCCLDCQGVIDNIQAFEKLVELFKELLLGTVRGGRADVAARAPEYFRWWMTDLAQSHDKGLLKLQAAGELPHADQWAGALAEVASWKEDDADAA